MNLKYLNYIALLISKISNSLIKIFTVDRSKIFSGYADIKNTNDSLI